MIDIKSIKSILKKKGGLQISQILFKKSASIKIDIPEKLKKDFIPINKKWAEKDRTNSFKNQDSLCVAKYQIKDQKIFLDLCEDKYITRQAISEVLGSMGILEQDVLLSEILNQKVKVPISYKINIGVITKDNKLLIVKRSSKVSTNKNKYDFGISKGVKPEDFSNKSFQPLMTSIRAIEEELNISLDLKSVVKNDAFVVKEFYLNREIFSLGFLCILDLRKLEDSYTLELIKGRSESSKNSWEMSEILGVDFNKKSLVSFLKKEGNKITNYSIYHMLQILEELD